jgi:hypothetical protein
VRGLKSLVIMLGVLLVGGMVALVAAIVWRGSHPPPPAGPLAAARQPHAQQPNDQQPYNGVLDLPAGAEIVSLSGAGERLILLLGLPGGQRQLMIIDMGSGARLGTIELRTGS